MKVATRRFAATKFRAEPKWDDQGLAGLHAQGRSGVKGPQNGTCQAEPLPQVGDQGSKVVGVGEEVGTEGSPQRTQGVDRGKLDDQAMKGQGK